MERATAQFGQLRAWLAASKYPSPDVSLGGKTADPDVARRVGPLPRHRPLDYLGRNNVQLTCMRILVSLWNWVALDNMKQVLKHLAKTIASRPGQDPLM